jgi:signal transduction histidine kinase
VTLSASSDTLTLKVQDDGHGFATQEKTAGFGLMGIRERVRHHGGTLHIASNAKGTQVTATMQFLTLT